ncbi:MAG: carbohydrate ABC transporter permease [Candidatus Caccosoma sp.]|nr:carbohydrate ABC transporter permease [Candidatus Caccosoma sp.]
MTSKANKKIKDYGIGTVLIYIVMILFALICVFPFIYELLLSFSSQQDYLAAKYIVLPKHPTLESYKYILFQDQTIISFLISLLVTVCGSAFTMIFSILGAYILSKDEMPGRKIFFVLILITMFFDGGLIPFYLTVKGLKLNNTLLALIIPFAISSYDMILLRNFFRQIPHEVIESAEMDGANELQVLFKFVVPLSMAGIVTISMFTIVAKWNDWYWPLIFLTLREDLFPLALQLRNVLMNQQGSVDLNGYVDMSKMFTQSQNAAMVMISILPIICAYPFLQKFFVKGAMMGAIKE